MPLHLFSERLPLHLFKAYLDYSMYVILDRALPHVGDGLKPVQRRILYAMSDLGLSATAKFKKSARTVGDVLGKFHPARRQRLLRGHGADGAVLQLPLSADRRPGQLGLAGRPQVLRRDALHRGASGALRRGAAGRDRAGHRRLAAELRRHAGGAQAAAGAAAEPAAERRHRHRRRHGHGHPVAQPARGRARLHPPAQAPERRHRDADAHVPGPDFPTAGEIITPRTRSERMYETGYGSHPQRACYELEQGDIVVTALPYQVSGNRIMEQVAAQMQAKKLPMIEDLRDESDHECPTRFVIVPRSNRVDVARLMSHLFATTDLEKSYRVNMNMIALDGRPRVMNLREILSEWISYPHQHGARRLQHRLDKVLERCTCWKAC
jgi:topoisomerase-4 subunit A